MTQRRDAEGAFDRTEAAAVVEVVDLRALRRRAVACEVRAAGTVRVCRVEGTLETRPAEERLRVGTHERNRNFGAPQHLVLNESFLNLQIDLSVSFPFGLVFLLLIQA